MTSYPTDARQDNADLEHLASELLAAQARLDELRQQIPAARQHVVESIQRLQGAGVSMTAVARLLDRDRTTIRDVLARHGSTRP